MTEAKSEAWICMFMDAMPFNLGFEIDDLQIVEMLPRHFGLEVELNEAAEKLVGISPPHDYAQVNPKIDDLIQRLRSGEDVECEASFPAAALGVLWAWQLVLKHDWTWCAVSQEWWETLAVCDPSKGCAILPVQYFRRLAKDTGEIGVTNEDPVEQWPADLLKEIEQGRLPVESEKSLVCIY